MTDGSVQHRCRQEFSFIGYPYAETQKATPPFYVAPESACAWGSRHEFTRGPASVGPAAVPSGTGLAAAQRPQPSPDRLSSSGCVGGMLCTARRHQHFDWRAPIRCVPYLVGYPDTCTPDAHPNPHSSAPLHAAGKERARSGSVVHLCPLEIGIRWECESVGYLGAFAGSSELQGHCIHRCDLTKQV